MEADGFCQLHQHDSEMAAKDVTSALTSRVRDVENLIGQYERAAGARNIEMKDCFDGLSHNPGGIDANESPRSRPSCFAGNLGLASFPRTTIHTAEANRIIVPVVIIRFRGLLGEKRDSRTYQDDHSMDHTAKEDRLELADGFQEVNMEILINRILYSVS
jgi:hypothetical protein